MALLELYKKINLIIPIEQGRFFSFYDDTINELLSLYNKFVIEKDSTYESPTSLEDDIVVLPLYHNAIIDNILFLAEQGDAHKSEFIRKSRAAYMKYWTDDAKGRRTKGLEW